MANKKDLIRRKKMISDMLLGASFVLAGLIALTITVFEREKTNLFMSLLFTAVSIILVIFGTSCMVADSTKGYPIENQMPPEYLPLSIKMFSVENGFAYITVVPHNRPETVYYKISVEHIDLDEIKPGMIIINDNGVLKKPFKSN